MKFDKTNPDHCIWLSHHPLVLEFLFHFLMNVKRYQRVTVRMIDLMHDKPMTKESIDTVIEYIKECGR